MEKFTASNGVEITLTNDGDEVYLLGKGEVMPDGVSRWTVATGGGEGIAALREFFQYERDQELGRWRWPENPDVVVKVDEDGEPAWVVDERNPRITGHVWRDDVGCSMADEQVVAAARDYFAAHPGPKPWMEVTEGVYAVTPQAHTYERLLLFRNGEWLHLYKSPNEGECDPHTAEWVAKIAYMEGRLTRIVPEVSGDV